MKFILIFAMTLFFSEDSRANEGELVKLRSALVNKSFELDDNKGLVHVVIHSRGHLQGMPYVVDLRPACAGDKKSWDKLDALDVKSACAVDVNSLSINNEKTEISILVHNPSLKSYNKQMQSGVRNVQPECETQAVKHTFSIKDFCSQ